MEELWHVLTSQLWFRFRKQLVNFHFQENFTARHDMQINMYSKCTHLNRTLTWLTIQQVPGTQVHIYARMQSWDEPEESSFLHTQSYIQREGMLKNEICALAHTQMHEWKALLTFQPLVESPSWNTKRALQLDAQLHQYLPCKMD